MKRIALVALCLMVLGGFASAEWTWVKSIDCSNAVTDGGRLKDIQADSSGSLYFTTYFGSATRRIWKIANPITETTPTLAAFETPAADYNSSNAATLAINATGDVFLAMDTNDTATAWIKKYKSDGTLDTTFGSSGTLSPVVLNGTNHRPRSICFADSGSGKLLVATFSWPYYIGAVDALTGADGGALLATVGDSDDNGTATDIEVWNGLAYDPVENAIYGNAQADLMKATGTSASLSDLSTFDSITMLQSNTRLNTSANGLCFLPSENLIAYTALQGTASAIEIGVYSILTELQDMAGEPAGYDGYINSGGACTLFTQGSSVYVAVVSYYSNTLEIFADTSAVDNWSRY